MINPYKGAPVQDFMLPDGYIGNMRDVVTINQGRRYELEVMLIQRALGVKSDGVIGPETRGAIVRLSNHSCL